MSFIGNTATDGFSITPSDTDNLAKQAQALLIGVAGNIHILTPSGTDIIYPVQAGINPIAAVKVFATSTTATGIFALTK